MPRLLDTLTGFFSPGSGLPQSPGHSQHSSSGDSATSSQDSPLPPAGTLSLPIVIEEDDDVDTGDNNSDTAMTDLPPGDSDWPTEEHLETFHLTRDDWDSLDKAQQEEVQAFSQDHKPFEIYARVAQLLGDHDLLPVAATPQHKITTAPSFWDQLVIEPNNKYGLAEDEPQAFMPTMTAEQFLRLGAAPLTCELAFVPPSTDRHAVWNSANINVAHPSLRFLESAAIQQLEFTWYRPFPDDNDPDSLVEACTQCRMAPENATWPTCNNLWVPPPATPGAYKYLWNDRRLKEDPDGFWYKDGACGECIAHGKTCSMAVTYRAYREHVRKGRSGQEFEVKAASGMSPWTFAVTGLPGHCEQEFLA